MAAACDVLGGFAGVGSSHLRSPKPTMNGSCATGSSEIRFSMTVGYVMVRMRVTLRVFKVVGAKRRLIATSARA